jgi:hypothetical protein
MNFFMDLNNPHSIQSQEHSGRLKLGHQKSKFQGKLRSLGIACMSVGYTDNQSRDLFLWLNDKTHEIMNSRVIIWLDKMNKDYAFDKPTFNKSIENDNDV